MALTLISEPIYAITAVPDYCTFNSVNRRIEFKFQRKDYIFSSGFTVVNVGGYVAFDLVTTTPTNAIAGDLIYYYSANYVNYITGFYEVTSIDTVNNRIIVNLPYVAVGSGTDFINVNPDRENYYAEIRLAVNGVSYYQKASADSTGLIKIDVSGTLRRLFDLKDDFDYFNSFQGKPTFINDANQALKFAVRYYERYTGSVDGGTNITRDYYAVNSTPEIYEESNLYKYIQPKNTKIYHTNWLSTFKIPTYFAYYPFDVQVILEIIAGVTNYGLVEYKDVNKVSIPGGDFSTVISNVYPTGIKRINAPFHKFVNYFGTRQEGYMIYWIVNFMSQNDTEQQFIKYDNICRDNPIYVKWLNKLGGWSYWLFSSSVEYGIESDKGSMAMARIANSARNNQREFTIPGKASHVLRLFDSQLSFSERDAWMDFMANDNIFMLRDNIKGKQVGQDYSLVDGTYKLSIYSPTKHDLKIGDYVQFFPTVTSTSLYPYKYIVTRIWDNYHFEVDTYYITQILLPTDAIWSKVIDANDWILCRKDNQSSNINSSNNTFSLSFDLINPSLSRRLK